MEADHSDLKRTVQNLEAESASYLKQFNYLLGAGSGAGIFAVLTFSSNLPDPTFALSVMSPAYFLFLLGVIATGATLVFRALRQSASAEHYAEAHNREQFNDAISKTVQVISAPPRLAEEANVQRNKMITGSKIAHERAEKAWVVRKRWNFMYYFSVFLSTTSFVLGALWPVFYIVSGGKLTP